MLKKSLWLGCAALAMCVTACSDDDINPNGPENGGGNEYDADGAYISVDVYFPESASSSRTPTGLTDEEIAKDAETALQSVAIVLADDNDNLVTYAVAGGSSKGKIEDFGSTATKINYRAIAVVSKTSISNFYYQSGDYAGSLKTEYQNGVRVYVICNPTNTILTTLASASGTNDWIDEIGHHSESFIGGAWTDDQGDEYDNIWTENQFLMTNAEIAVRKLPVKQTDWDQCSEITHPFQLSGNTTFTGSTEILNYYEGGAVKVQRACARFDYADGGDAGTSTYTVFYTEDAYGGQHRYIDVELCKMSLVNMSRHFYFFKRVSADGQPDGATAAHGSHVTYCGQEVNVDAANNIDANYVVDVDAAWKSKIYSQWNTIPNTANSNSKIDQIGPYLKHHFLFPFFDQSGTTYSFADARLRSQYWYTTKISDVLGKTDDRWTDNWSGNGSYHIWRYATENAIPAPIDAQVNGLSTGVVFKAKLKVHDESASNSVNGWDPFAHYEKDLLAAIRGEKFDNETDSRVDDLKYPILYQMNGKLYYTWNHVRSEALLNALGITKESEITLSADGSKWELTGTPNTSNTDYVAVFGSGGFGRFKLKLTVTDESGNQVETEAWVEDNTGLGLDPDAPNTKALKWNDENPETGEQGTNYRTNDTYMAEFKDAVTNHSGITIFQASYDSDFAQGTNYQAAWGYYCYYYYWNRHNDNLEDGVMGPMEFAVIRNNVYKLKVLSISRLGHPRLLENDPNSPIPGTKDESGDIYMSVQCEVLPWVVRENNIRF